MQGERRGSVGTCQLLSGPGSGLVDIPVDIWVSARLLGIRTSWERQRDAVFHEQQAQGIGMHQPPSICAEAIQSNLV